MAYWSMLAGSFFFSLMGILTESLSQELSFLALATIRSAIATAVAAWWVWRAQVEWVVWRPADLWMRSLAGCASMLCLFYAITHYQVAVILSLTNMFPVWVGLLSWPLLGQFPKRETWIALAISILGMSLIFQAARQEIASSPPSYPSATERLREPLVLSSQSHEVQAHWRPKSAVAAAIAAGFLSGVALIGLHRVRNIDARMVVTHFSAVSTLIAGCLWLATPGVRFLENLPLQSWLRVLGVGLSAVIGQWFLTLAFSKASPARVSVVGLSQVVMTTLYAGWVQQRWPNAVGFLGMSLIVGATGWVLLKHRAGSEDTPPSPTSS